MRILANMEKEICVIDLYAVPDYETFFSECVDPNFDRAFKGKYTKLQFTFTYVGNIDPLSHPVGVKMTCRKYCSEHYPELIVDTDPSNEIGFKVQVVRSIDFPEEGGKPLNVLLCLPTKTEILPDQFLVDSDKVLKAYASKLRAKFQKDKKTMKDLDKFLLSCPTTDRVEDFITPQNPLHIPFEKEFLKRNASTGLKFVDRRVVKTKDLLAGYPVVDDTDSIRRSTAISSGGGIVYTRPASEIKPNANEYKKVTNEEKYGKCLRFVGKSFRDLVENTMYTIAEVCTAGKKQDPFFALKQIHMTISAEEADFQ